MMVFGIWTKAIRDVECVEVILWSSDLPFHRKISIESSVVHGSGVPM